MRLYWFKLLGVLTALVLAVVFYGQYYVWLVARNSIQRTVAKPESLDKDLIGHLQFYGSHEDQKKSSTAKLRNIILMKEDEPLACPSSLQLRAKEDSLYKTLFNFDIPLLMWDSHMTESNWRVLSKRPVPYGWKDLPREDVSSTLKLLNDSANQMMFEFKPPQSCVRCAVVGNGGILNGSRKGKEIDEHDYVFRQNGAITKGFEEDVGTKTSFYGFTVNTMKNSLIAYEADGFLSTPKGEAIQYIFIPSDLRDYVMLRSAIMGVPVPTGTDKGDMPSLYFGPETSPKKFKLLHPEFLLYTRDRFLPSEILNTEYARLYMPSTGGLMLLSALHSCDQVSAYGFITRSYNLYSDHYYEKKKQTLEFYANHDLLMEMKLWEMLHKKGIMKLYQRGQDNDKEGKT